MLSVMQAVLWMGCLMLLWGIGSHVSMMDRHVRRQKVSVRLAPSARADEAMLRAENQHPTLTVPQLVAPPLLEEAVDIAPKRTATSASAHNPSAVPPCSPSRPLRHPSQSLPAPPAVSGQVPVRVEAATIAASSPWIACQVAVREGMLKMTDDQATDTTPYLACFVVEGCGSHDIAGETVCERVLDVATATLVSRLTEEGNETVEAALRACVTEANHMLVQDNEAHHGYLTASLAIGLCTTTQLWRLATGQTALVFFQDGQVQQSSDSGNEVFLGEQECDGRHLVVMQQDAHVAESILLGAGEGWSSAATLLRESDGMAEQLASDEGCQHIVATVAAATTGAVAGLLIVRERPPLSPQT
jgi:hypothetical protein